MKAKVDKEHLEILVGKAQNIVEKRNTMPELINALLEVKGENLHIYTTDLEVSLTDQMKVKAEKQGKITVDAKKLFDIVRELNKGEIHLEVRSNHRLEIRQGKSLFHIVGATAEEFPVFPTFKTEEFMEVDTEILLHMIERTIYSVSNDETRYHLNGVYFENENVDKKVQFRMVATDGHRLSLVNRFSQKAAVNKIPSGVIVPRKGLIEIKKIVESKMIGFVRITRNKQNKEELFIKKGDEFSVGEKKFSATRDCRISPENEFGDIPLETKSSSIENISASQNWNSNLENVKITNPEAFWNHSIQMAIEGSQLIVKVGYSLLMIRLIAGKYPDYGGLIPKNMDKSILVTKESLLNSIRRVALFSDQKSKRIVISVSKNKMEITSDDPNLGDAKEEIDVEYSGAEIKIAFNFRYILDILNSFEEERLNLQLKDSSSPGLFRPESSKRDGDYACVVMPMLL